MLLFIIQTFVSSFNLGIRVTLRPYSDVGSAALIGSDESSIEGDALTVFLTAAASPSKQTTSKPKKKSNKKKKKSNKKKKKKAAPVVDNEKLIKAAIKEGGKKGQDIAGLSEMGGVWLGLWCVVCVCV